MAARIPPPVHALRPGGRRCLVKIHPLHAKAAGLVKSARQLVRKARYDEALARLDQAILLEPECAARHLARGVLLSLLGREQEALSFARAIPLAKAQQEQALIYFHRGLLYGRRKEYDQALLDMKRAQRLDPSTQTNQEAIEQISAEKNLFPTHNRIPLSC